MKTTILAAALALPLTLTAWAQAPEANAVSAKPAEVAKPAEAAKPAPKTKLANATRKASDKRHQDARHCLERPNNDAIIRCAEEYL